MRIVEKTIKNSDENYNAVLLSVWLLPLEREPVHGRTVLIDTNIQEYLNKTKWTFRTGRAETQVVVQWV